MRPKIAYLRLGPRPIANRTVHEVLVDQLPEFDVVPVDVKSLLRRDPAVMGRMTTAAAVRYGPTVLLGRHHVKKALFRTRTAFDAMQAAIARALEGERWACTFQMQSLFDGSRPGVPHIVYTDHTHMANLSYASFDRRRLYSRAWIESEQQVYDRANAVLTRSSNIARSVVADYGVDSAKVDCVFVGPNVPFESAAQQRDPLEILFIGSDWRRKGGPQLLAAFEDVRRRVPGAHLTVIGPAQRDLPRGVTNLGRQPKHEIWRHLTRAGVFCLPTLLEPFGVVLVEALAAGLPIVASAVGAVPDMVEDGRNGRLVPPGDVAALADALTEIVGDARMQERFGTASRELANARYDWGVVGRRLRSHVIEAMDAHGAGSLATGTSRR